MSPYIKKNIFFITFLLIFFKNINASLVDASSKEYISRKGFLEGIVRKIQTNVILDKKNEGCDLIAKEKVLFSFDKLTSDLKHVIFSRRNSLYDFKVKISDSVANSNPNLRILDTKLYSNSQVKRLLYNAFSNSDSTRNFKETWLISINLSVPVKEIEIEFFYNIQYGLYIDTYSRKNIFQYEFINPYSFPLNNFQLNIEIKNFNDLNIDNIKSPEEGFIQSLIASKGLKITLNKNLPEMSQYSINLPLPYEIDSCNKTFADAVNIILYSTTFLITIIGLITCFKLSKE